MKNFFATNSGLTSTSANHICNIAKEAYEKLEVEVENISFIKETISIIGNLEETETVLPQNTLQNIESILEKISKYKSLIAWLREAIKEKNKLYSEAQDYISKEYCELQRLQPIKGTYKTEEDVINSWSVKERFQYYNLQTECAVIGKTIHPNGSFSKAKKRLIEKTSKPVMVEKNGRDTIITKYYSTLSIDDIEKYFFKLQKKHRSLQAQLNGIEHKISLEIREYNNAIDQEYKMSLDKWHEDCQSQREADKLYRESLSKEIEALKIIIPNDLKEVYEEINSL